MADRFPNIPNTPTEFVDGNLFPDALPQGAVVAVVGSAVRGPSKVGSRVLSESSGLTRFGNQGSLARGLAQVFQGGTSNALAVRMFATAGKIEHIGSVTGIGGLTLETTVEGSDALSQYSAIYVSQTDQLKVYNVSSGALVLDKTGDVVDLDLGEIIVFGEGENAYEDDFAQIFGSIGRKVPVLPDETLQKATLTAGGASITLVPATGLNVGRLGYLGSQTPIAVQLLNEDGDALAESRVAGVNVSTGVVTLSPAIDGAWGDGSEDDGAREHSVRFVSLYQAERLDRVVEGRLAQVGADGPELLVTPGSNFNGLPLVSNSDGVRADSALAEVEPHVMNRYEALVETQDVLEAARIDALVVMDIYMDSPALDGQTVGDTALPDDAASGLIGESVNGDALVQELVATTIGERADRVLVEALTQADRDQLVNALTVAGRGQSWIVFDEPKGDAFADEVETDEIIRSARILNWENVGVVEVTTVATRADVLDDLDATRFTFHDGTTAYYVWYDASGGAADPAPGGTGIEVTIASDATAAAVATATQAAIQASAARVTVGRVGATLTITNLDVANVAAATAATSGFTVAVTQAGTEPEVLLHFDRDVTFSGFADGSVLGGENPSFKIYNTSLLFFYRNFLKDGEVKHCWYTSKYDPEGNQHHEVNFAYKLAAVCHSLTESETPVLGYIGVREPANLFRKKDVDAWIGTAPLYDQEGNVVRNGSGLLGNKFIAGRGLNNAYDAANQFSAGFKLTVSGELDDEDIVLDTNEFEVDLGKFISIVSSWVIVNNAWTASQASRIGRKDSAAALYAGLANILAPWSATTQKSIGRGGARVPTVIGKAKVNALSGVRYVVLTQDSVGNTVVVDGPTAALPTSDFTRNMSMRLLSEMIRNIRDAGRPFLGEPLGPLQKSSLETALNTALNATRQASLGAIQGFSVGLAQTDTDRLLGRVRVRLSASMINELRKIFIEVSLTR